MLSSIKLVLLLLVLQLGIRPLQAQSTDSTSASTINVIGGGASFPSSLYMTLAAEYSNQSNIFVSYTANNSGWGRQALSQFGKYTFAGSDNLVNPMIFNTPGLAPVQLLPIPSTVGGICIVLNIGRDSTTATNQPLLLTRQNILDIFTFNVTAWNDRSLTQNNPFLATINQNIQIVVRSGSSGTTSNFIKGLNSFSGKTGTAAALSDSGIWPVQAPVGRAIYQAGTNANIGTVVGSVPYTISYMDYADAIQNPSVTNFEMASVQNKKSLNFIKPAPQQFQAAASQLMINSSIDLTTDALAAVINSQLIDTDATADAYPLMAATYYLVRNDTSPNFPQITETQMRETLRFLWWTLFNGTEAGAVPNPTYLNASLAHSLDNFAMLPFAIRNFSYSVMRQTKFQGNLLFQSNSVCNPSFGPDGSYLAPNSTRTTAPSLPACWSTALNSPYGLNYILLALMCLGVVIIGIIFFLLLLNRDHPYVRALAPSCCYFVLVGCLVGIFAGYVYNVIPIDGNCRFRLVLPPIAFTMIFGMTMLKAYRIYLIFGYTRASRTSVIPNFRLILYTLVMTAITAVLCLAWILVSQPVATTTRIGSQVISTCVPTNYLADQIFQGVLFVYNGIILVVCLILAIATRGAHARFQESKSISLCVYSVTITLIVGLPIVYLLPLGSSALLFTIASFVRSLILIILSTAVAIFLYGPRLAHIFGHATDDELKRVENFSDTSGDDVTDLESPGMRSWSVQAMTYDVGVQGMKVGSAWTSVSLLLLPEMDLVVFLESLDSAKTLASAKVSAVTIETIEAHMNEPSKRIELRASHWRHPFKIEFVSVERRESFVSLFQLVKNRSQTTSTAVTDNVAAFIDNRRAQVQGLRKALAGPYNAQRKGSVTDMSSGSQRKGSITETGYVSPRKGSVTDSSSKGYSPSLRPIDSSSNYGGQSTPLSRGDPTISSFASQNSSYSGRAHDGVFELKP
ncbi:uncharacterized protein BJ171DRAFT_613749 [Polychytrium aggregatum]|uniref:uncharacterized protein n=1 Tax=Polychytrium aggregatum TaxID=110093 RepID=UPI0022FEE723|nr:uncharacterized protein BJ171DRAFT_613749 [Polychytrium aggregatum]KAI9205779.1 hypothetical protein BJ171DRAFT_613749 [Polychytrium aggregatum]